MVVGSDWVMGKREKVVGKKWYVCVCVCGRISEWGRWGVIGCYCEGDACLEQERMCG